jgi:hypothetical protein
VMVTIVMLLNFSFAALLYICPLPLANNYET